MTLTGLALVVVFFLWFTSRKEKDTASQTAAAEIVYTNQTHCNCGLAHKVEAFKSGEAMVRSHLGKDINETYIESKRLEFINSLLDDRPKPATPEPPSNHETQ